MIGSALAVMLVFPESTLRGTRTGLLLWYQYFLPAIFPFMILSGLLSGYLKKGGSLFAVITGFLNGYPNGAKTAADLSRRGLLPKETAGYYAVFCNLSGPMFLVSYAGLKRELPIIYLTSAVLLFIFCQMKRRTNHSQKQSAEISREISEEMPPGDYLMECTRVMVKAGIYIMYFSILIEMLVRHFSSSFLIRLLIPFLELTTGIACIQDPTFPLPSFRRYFRLFLCVSGGLCTAFQAKEVTYGLDLSIPRYLFFKLIQSFAVCAVCFAADMLIS